jgi:hypothetical protein
MKYQVTDNPQGHQKQSYRMSLDCGDISRKGAKPNSAGGWPELLISAAAKLFSGGVPNFSVLSGRKKTSKSRALLNSTQTTNYLQGS